MKVKLSAIVWLAVIAAATVLPLGAQPLGPPANLLRNPSFEQPQEATEQAALGWAPYQCGYTRTREKSYAPDISGPWSIRLSGTGTETERGMGGTNTGVSDGLPSHGTFAATNSIYVESFTQGCIYLAYITAGYADGTEKTFSTLLSEAQIKANLGTWKTYRLTFSTDPQKKLKSLTHWCLVWSKGQQKFAGTVYFDEVELRQVETGGQAEGSLPFALASRTPAPPRLDGVSDDECWGRALELSPFLLGGGTEAATEQTRARVAYDDSHLYLFMECLESVLDPVLQKRAAFKADQTAPDSNVFSDDAIELFLQPVPGQSTYYHLAINSRGAVYDARCQSEGVFDKSWTSGARVGTKVGERSWTLEVAIPREALGAGAFTATDRWRVNLCRTEKPAAENSCWSPTGGPFHTPSRFGLIAFGPPAVGGGTVNLGALRKGDNALQLTLSNADAAPHTVAVTASAAAGGTSGEVGRALARLAPGQTQTLTVPYVAAGVGGLGYEVLMDGHLLLASPTYPIQSDNPFIAYSSVLDKASTHTITDFSVAQGEPLVLPLVLLAGIEEPQFRTAEVVLEVPAFLHLVSPLGTPRRCPSPLRVQQQTITREGQPYRRVSLTFGASSVTFAAARQARTYVENPLLFRADYVGRQAPDQAPYPLAYEVFLNGQSKASGSVPLTLLDPQGRKSPRQVVVCNWPCGGTYLNAFLGRLSVEEQLVILDAWTRSGFNTYNHAGPLGKRYKELGLKTAEGLPGTLNDLCGSVPAILDYLRANPQFQDANLAGKPLPNVVSPAHLLEPDCPVRPLLRDFVGKRALQHPVLSWDYEVPVARPESIGFGTHNLAAFRKFAKITDTVALTAEVAARDYRPQWVDFRCRQNAEVVKLLQEGIKAANPQCEFFVYSGYQGPHTQETYGINWEYLAPHLDQGWCGYGRPVQQIQDTLRALGDKPLVGGELAWLGYGHAYDMKTTEINLMRRLTDCAGGVMVYYDWFVDGRFYTALSRTAAVAADFEEFFVKGKRDDSLATVQAGSPADVTVYALGDERVVFLFGAPGGVQEFRLELKGLPAGASAVDYWEKKALPVAPLRVTVPANGVKVIYLRPAASAAPAPPRLLSPVAQAISDRRPLLLWDQLGAASCHYRVEVSSARTFPAASTLCATAVAANTHVVTEPLDEYGTHYWRVRATDAVSGKHSAWSAVGEFTLGVLGVAVGSSTFSPNGDGAYDTVALQAELRNEAPWTVTVVDAAGRLIRTFSGKSAQLLATWDGLDGAGKPALEGRYELRLAVKGQQIAAESVELNRRFGVPNPDLERWCFWRPQALEGGTTEQDYHTPAGNRSYSLKLTGADPEARAYWSNYRSGTEIPITAGKTYTYSGLLKTDLAKGAQAIISLHFFTKDDRWAQIPGLEAEWTGVVAAAEGQQDWKELTVSCQAPANATKAVLFFSLKGQGQAWLAAAKFGESTP